MNTPFDVTGLTIRTPRLILRPFREGDLEDFYAYARVDGVGQMAGWTPHRSMEESREILAMFMREKKTFALEYEGKVVGSLGVERYNEGHYPELAGLKGREIGYVLSKDYWGRGLMTEAVRAVIGYLFDEIGLDFIMVGHFDHNSRSRRVIEKCGFQYVKTTDFETHFGTVEKSLDYILYHPERSDHHADA